MIGLCGCHRTGKTTLAKAFAQQQDIPFLQTAVSEVHKAAGIDPKKELQIDDRIALQEVILHTLEKQYAGAAKAARVWVADRTPLDVACYMLADVQRTTVVDSPERAELIVDFVGRCIKATNRWFSTVVLIQPGIKPSEKEGSARFCPAYMEHFNHIAAGLLLDERLQCAHYFIPRRYLELDDRLRSLGHAASHAIEENAARLQRVNVH